MGITIQYFKLILEQTREALGAPRRVQGNSGSARNLLRGPEDAERVLKKEADNIHPSNWERSGVWREIRWGGQETVSKSQHLSELQTGNQCSLGLKLGLIDRARVGYKEKIYRG